MNTVIVAPHPDDELLGCGGTLLKRASQGHTLSIIYVTSLSPSSGHSTSQIEQRQSEISATCKQLSVVQSNVHQFDFPPSSLNSTSIPLLIEKISTIFKSFQPNEVFLPFPGDAHSDHKHVFESAIACTKTFRYPSIRDVLVYETLSETNFNINPLYPSFTPNIYIDISPFFERKLQLLQNYDSEFLPHPFARSLDSVKSLAMLRGSEISQPFAESFWLLKSIQ